MDMRCLTPRCELRGTISGLASPVPPDNGFINAGTLGFFGRLAGTGGILVINWGLDGPLFFLVAPGLGCGVGTAGVSGLMPVTASRGEVKFAILPIRLLCLFK
jgi:hypothetical protein